MDLVGYLRFMIPRLPYLLLSCLGLMGCSSVEKQLNEAAVYEEAGMLEDAYGRYADVHARRDRNVQAHIGMQRTAQRRCDMLETEASMLYRAGELQRGDAALSAADLHAARLERAGIHVIRDPLLPMIRNEARASASTALFEQASIAFRNDRFEEAESLCTAALKLEPNDKDAEHLRKMAQLEPLYREGMRAEELGLWRDAFRRYTRITDRDPAYRDAWERKAQALSKASYTLAYVPVFDPSPYAGTNSMQLNPGAAEKALSGSIRKAILDLHDPLIILVDRENTDELLAEQQRVMNGTYDDVYAAEAGKLMGVKYVLTCRMLRYDEVLSRQIEVQVQIIDTETGRIHIAEMVRVHKLELDKGNTRAQLVDRAAERIAQLVATFDPYAK